MSTKLPAAMVEALRDADLSIRSLVPGDHRKLYNLWRVSMGTLTPVDSFYLAFYRDERFLVVPYMYDGQEYTSPGYQLYGPDGLGSWIRNNSRPYRYYSDNGLLLHRGHSFGDAERLSADAVVVPLFAGPRNAHNVVGLASIQSYRPDVYDDHVVRAFEWLAAAVMKTLAREREDADEREALLADDGIGQIRPQTLTEVVDKAGQLLDGIRVKILALAAQGQVIGDAFSARLAEIEMDCERAQMELVELLAGPTDTGAVLLSTLTPREREIALLVVDELTNAQIADILVISEFTVRTHVTRILNKFGVRQRAAVMGKLRPFG